jgi:hypothetical protein
MRCRSLHRWTRHSAHAVRPAQTSSKQRARQRKTFHYSLLGLKRRKDIQRRFGPQGRTRGFREPRPLSWTFADPSATSARVNRVTLAACRSLPVCTELRTYRCTAITDVMCHEETSPSRYSLVSEFITNTKHVSVVAFPQVPKCSICTRTMLLAVDKLPLRMIDQGK